MDNQKNPQEEKPKNQPRNVAALSGIVFQMLAIIGLGTFAGIKLDERYPNEYQLYTIICSFAAFGISMYSVIKQINKFTNQNDRSNEKGND